MTSSISQFISSFLCNKKKIMNNYCLIYSNIAHETHETHIIKIQSIYRSFYVRKKLKLFYKLPINIQKSVNINKNIYLKHFHSGTSILIYKKINDFYSINDYKNVLNIKANEFYYTYMLKNINFNTTEFFNHLNYIIKMIKKYNMILDSNKNSYIYIIFIIHKFIKQLINFMNNNNIQNYLMDYYSIWNWLINYYSGIIYYKKINKRYK